MDILRASELVRQVWASYAGRQCYQGAMQASAGEARGDRRVGLGLAAEWPGQAWVETIGAVAMHGVISQS
jgi:hypothetical protein